MAKLNEDDLKALIGKLNKRQKLFCEEYIVDLNATQAAIRAGYSETAAAATGSRMLRNNKVSKYVQHLAHTKTAAVGVTAERVIAEFAKIAFSDVKDLIEIHGDSVTVKDLEAMKASGVIKKFKVNQVKDQDGNVVGSIVEVEQWDKMSALSSLARYFALFTDNVDVTTKGKELPQWEATVLNINHRPAGVAISREKSNKDED